jgi:hypothetical protein
MLELRNKYEKKYAEARTNLLVMAGLTLVNLVLILIEADITFTFSAFMPQVLLAVGSVMQQETGITLFMVVGATVAVLSVGIYFLCWILSKKRAGWMIAAMVLFILDSLSMPLMLGGFDASVVIDIVFHAWVLYYLITGVHAASKLRELPSREELELAAAQEQQAQQSVDELLNN